MTLVAVLLARENLTEPVALVSLPLANVQIFVVVIAVTLALA